jgi:hypothetical protein
MGPVRWFGSWVGAIGALLDRVREGGSAALVLRGEPGIGKPLPLTHALAEIGARGQISDHVLVLLCGAAMTRGQDGAAYPLTGAAPLAWFEVQRGLGWCGARARGLRRNRPESPNGRELKVGPHFPFCFR